MDIISIAPAPAPDSPVQTANPSGANGDSDFNSELNQAISATDNRNSRQDRTPTHSDNQQSKAAGTSRETDGAANSQISVSSQDEITELDEGIEPATQLPGSDTADKEHTGILFSSIMIKASLELPQGSQKAANTVPPDLMKSSESITTSAFASFAEEELISTETLLKNTNQEKAFQSPYLSITIKGEASAQFPLGNNGLSDKNSLLLAELQKLISNNNDKVQMTATFTTPAGKQELPGFMGSPLISQLASESAKLVTQSQDKSLSAVAGVTTDQLSQIKTENQVPQLRQDIQGQFLNSKSIGSEKSMEGNVDNETLQQNGNSQQQTIVTTANTAPIPGHEQQTTNSFSNSLHESFSNTPVDSTKNPLPQPNVQSHLIREQEIINQIVQRFSVQSHLQSSRMSLQLHPAELGELKIDLLVKGDSLKGNIIAHTQQAQEIIEKNLPKLRTILQEQGISIEDLIVTFDSDNVDDFSKQQEQLFQEQFATLSHQKKRSAPLSFEQTIEETFFSEENDTPGVNLTA